MTTTQENAVDESQRIIAQLRLERDVALAREAALAEVLNVINRSPGDPGPVFEAILEKAHILCGAVAGSLGTIDGEHFRYVATHGYDEGYAARRHQPFRPKSVHRAMLSGQQRVDIPDVRTYQFEAGAEAERAYFENSDLRTCLMVPLLKDGSLLGYISGFRKEVRPFSEPEFALLQSFGAQAVSAIENARLITAQQGALERQTAVADVLRAINAWPGDTAPVFDLILKKAHRLCGAEVGTLATFDGEYFLAVATHGFPDRQMELVSRPYRPHGSLQPLVDGERFVHDPDIQLSSTSSSDPIMRGSAAGTGLRTALAVPLRKDGSLVGYISAFRREVRLFSQNEIALLEQFAAQAVIAMENARLINEQREALEQQTATAEVLQVINASPVDLTPVFETLLEKAVRPSEGAFGTIATYDRVRFHSEASRGVPAAVTAAVRPMTSPEGSPIGLLETKRPVHILDLKDHYGYRAGRAMCLTLVDLGGVRTDLVVPLLKDGAVCGLIAVHRQEVRAFSDKQIALLENFAAQAVIAIENARLIDEQREALERQTATAEVLQVINASPGNLEPVFQAIVEKAHVLCDAAHGSLQLWDGELFRGHAMRGFSEPMIERLRQGYSPWPNMPCVRIVEGADVVHCDDLAEIDDPTARYGVEFGGVRTVLYVALRKDGVLLGQIVATRQEVRPFSDKEISLVQDFAAQAVIAMENARLINEQREALEQQTATAQVLQVINASPGDLAPVFEAILEKSMALLGSSVGELYTYDGENFATAAVRGYSPDYAAFRAITATKAPPGGPIARLLETKRPVQILDLKEEPLYRDGNVGMRATVDIGGTRTVLDVPLLKEDAVVGMVCVARREVRAFSDKQIALLENFAAQAVIAMENARLLQELRARTDELAHRQEELRLTFENMGDGVAMFDQEPRLVAWNTKFQEMFAVPDDLLRQRLVYADYIRHLARRGDYGPDVDIEEQVHGIAANMDQYRVTERTRPEGRVIEIRNNPVADGGFVMMFSNITERKRNEAEIAAARDAAQEATRTIEAAFRELKTAQANLIQAEKMASLGQLTAGIAHEIKNPLDFVNNFAILSVELLAELKDSIAAALALLTEDQRADVEETVGMLTSNLEKINEHGKRADGIVKAMLEHSRGASGERREVDINALADEALNLSYHGARAQDQSFNITLERDFQVGIAPIEVNPQDLTRVFLNLFSNGFYAANKRAKNGAATGFTPVLKISTRDAGNAVEVRVRDNGTGIPTDIRDKLFQPFFTTKPTGEGTGLGLSITYDIVTKQHGGTISVDSEVDAFTEFVVTLPRGMFPGDGARA